MTTQQESIDLAIKCPACSSVNVAIQAQTTGAGVLICSDCLQVFAIKTNDGSQEPEKINAPGSPRSNPDSDDSDGVGGDGDGVESSSDDDSSDKTLTKLRFAADKSAGEEDCDEGDYEVPDDFEDAGGESSPSTGSSDSSVSQEELQTSLPKSALTAWKNPKRYRPSADRRSSTPTPTEEEIELMLHGFTRKLGAVLKDNQFKRARGGQRRGDLHQRSLYKAGIGQGSPRVFERKTETQDKQYAFVIAVDCSGSMRAAVRDHSGDSIYRSWAKSVGEERGLVTRAHLAGYVTQVLTESLEKHGALVTAFGYNSFRSMIKTVHAALTPKRKRRKGSTILTSLVNNTGGANCDYLALAEAAREVERLKVARPGIHPIVIMIADGGIQPGEINCVIRPVDKRGRSIVGKGGSSWVDVVAGKLATVTPWSIPLEQPTRTGIQIHKAPGVRVSWVGGQRVTQLHTLAASMMRDGADIITIGIADDGLTQWFPNCHIVHDEQSFMEATIKGINEAVNRHQHRSTKS